MTAKNTPEENITIAVTGLTGFVGKRLAQLSRERHVHLRALTRREQPKSDHITWVNGSLDHKASLAQLVDGADMVLHIAGVVNAPDKAGFVAGNITGTQNLTIATKQAGIEQFIHVSSLAATLPDLSVYGWSKAGAEDAVKQSGLNWAMVRPPAIYGPGDTEMLDMFKMAKKGVMMMPPKGALSLIHADDLCRCLLAICCDTALVSGKIYEVDDGRENGWTHREFGEAIGYAMGRTKPVKVLHAPGFLLKTAARADMTFRKDKAKLTLDRAHYMAHRDWTINPDLRPPASLWQPQIETQAGLADTAKWYREQGWL